MVAEESTAFSSVHAAPYNVNQGTFILGLSAYYHDSAACLVRDGEIIAAAQEERFTRKKHDHSFPVKAVKYCLHEAGIAASDLDHVVFYDKPLQKFERLLETYLDYAPAGIRSFLQAMPLWLKEKLWIREQIAREAGFTGTVLFTEHHESHAASAFFPSPFESAAILTIDGVGEWATGSFGAGKGNRIDLLAETRFPHSLGLLYSAFTYYLGFKVNSGEYKVMALAPYGEPKYTQKILDEVVDLRPDGSMRLNMKLFNYCQGLTMTNSAFDRVFGGPPRKPESEIAQREMDLAHSIQQVTEMAMLRMANHVHKVTNEKNLVLAGGVALNCVGNGRLLREGPFENIWIQPAAGDAGGALGAALSTWHQYLGKPRTVSEVCRGRIDGMKAACLGPSFRDAEVCALLESQGARYRRMDRSEIIGWTARQLAEEKVVGWFQGRMEFGPRALGARSILADPRSQKMQSMLNLKIKFRESFRPFAPSVIREAVSDYFEMDCDSALHAVRSAGPSIHPPQHDVRGREAVRHRQAQHSTVRHPGRHARRLLGASTDRAPGGERHLLRPDRRVRPLDGLPGPRQHVVQRPGRADCLHAGGRLQVLHADRNGRAGHRPFRS